MLIAYYCLFIMKFPDLFNVVLPIELKAPLWVVQSYLVTTVSTIIFLT